MSTIILAEDEQVLRESLADLLQSEGYTVRQAATGSEAYEIAVEEPVDLVLTDVRMPEMDGVTLLGKLRQLAPETPVIVMTAYGTVENAVEAMQLGAWDYLLKPVQFDDVLLRIKRAFEYREISRDRRVLADQIAEQGSFHNLISEAPEMLALFEQARQLSNVKSNVLLIGESGTGKELFARAIHYNGVTRSKPFIAVNSGAIPESLIASELFGHRKGAFTGAIADRRGFFEAADGGTLFLDEISTLPKNLQSTLLRVLEERAVVPVGDTRPRPVDVRVITASNQDLEALVRQGDFREDLYFRVNVAKLVLPPLRHHKGDIPLLVHHFLEKYTIQMNRTVNGLTNGAMRAMLNYDWPGNVRELENAIERAVIFVDKRELRVADLPFATDQPDDDPGEDLRSSLAQFERQHIISSLRRHNYDKNLSAAALGIGISSLYRKLDDLDIPKNLDAAEG